jgi:PKD repeat protein
MQHARHNRPIAEFAVSCGRPAPGRTIHLYDSSSDPGGAGIAWRAWDFGDDTTATGSSPAHRYRRPGTYTITLTVGTFDGRVSTARRGVEVAPC